MKNNVFNKKIGFIGAGNMAEALVSGLIKSGFPSKKIFVFDIDKKRLGFFSKKYKLNKQADNVSVVKNADVIVLAVKPYHVEGVLKETGGFFNDKKLLISIAAGTKTKKIEKYLGKVPVVRSMPNTPALVGKGAFAVSPGRYASESDMKIAEKILGCCGLVVRVTESKIDAVTAVSGSGPAYLFYVAEIMRKTAQKIGLEKKIAKILVNQTLLGSSYMLAESAEEPDALRARVTSKGGTTQAALNVLKKKKFAGIFEEAILAAEKRSEEIADEKT